MNSRDKQGRTPLYYADPVRRQDLVQYMVQAGATMPMHSQDRRPSITKLPQQYLMVLQEIETRGWNSVNWKDGYTMLHWAAEKDHGDLCRYLISLDADIMARDGKDRSPLQLARSSNSASATLVLEELASCGSEMNLQAFRGVPGSTASFLGGRPHAETSSQSTTRRVRHHRR